MWAVPIDVCLMYSTYLWLTLTNKKRQTVSVKFVDMMLLINVCWVITNATVTKSEHKSKSTLVSWGQFAFPSRVQEVGKHQTDQKPEQASIQRTHPACEQKSSLTNISHYHRLCEYSAYQLARGLFHPINKVDFTCSQSTLQLENQSCFSSRILEVFNRSQWVIHQTEFLSTGQHKWTGAHTATT